MPGSIGKSTFQLDDLVHPIPLIQGQVIPGEEIVGDSLQQEVLGKLLAKYLYPSSTANDMAEQLAIAVHRGFKKLSDLESGNSSDKKTDPKVTVK